MNYALDFGTVLSTFREYNLKRTQMKKDIAKKTIILYVLVMLYKGSSMQKPITQTQMAKVINSLGVPCSRRTVGRNIRYLIDFGLPIFKVSGGYCYVKHLDKFFG